MLLTFFFSSPALCFPAAAALWNAWYNYFNGPTPWWNYEQQRLFSNGANQAPLPNFNVAATTAALQRNRTGNPNHNQMWAPNNPMAMGSTNGPKWNKNKNQYSKNNNSTTKA